MSPRISPKPHPLHPSLRAGTTPPDASKLDPITLAIRNARAEVRERREARAHEARREAAARMIQSAWRGFEARSRLTLFRAGDRWVSADNAKILARGACPSISAAIRRGAAVDLRPMSANATEAFLTFLETGSLHVGMGLAQELKAAAARHGVPSLGDRCTEILTHHSDPAPELGRWFRATAGWALLAQAQRGLEGRLGALRSAGFEPRSVPTRVGRIHALDRPGTGEGPPLIVVHGVAASSLHMSSFLLHLARGPSRIVAIDLLGHGLSEVPASKPLIGTDVMDGFRDAAQALVKEPAWVYGNSFGGMNAVRFALDAPDRVAGLVLASPAGAPLRLPSRERLLDRFRLANHAQALEAAQKMGLSGLQQVLAAFALEARFAAPHLRQLVESADNAACFRGRDLRGGLPMPVLLLFGKKDDLLDGEHRGFYMRNLPPHAVREEPEDLGHVPQLEAPERIAARVLAFMRTAHHERASFLPNSDVL